MQRDAGGRERFLIPATTLAVASLEFHAALHGGAAVAVRHDLTVAPDWREGTHQVVPNGQGFRLRHAAEADWQRDDPVTSGSGHHVGWIDRNSHRRASLGDPAGVARPPRFVPSAT